MKFRKKPIVIDAIQWTGGRDQMKVLDKYCGLHWGRADTHDVAWGADDDAEHMVIYNVAEQQWLCCPVGHRIIKGIEGELYPCAPQIFAATYEPAEQS